MSAEEGSPFEGIAIIGMGCRFPGANDPETFWRNLIEGKESITFFEPGQLDPSIPAELINDPNYVKASGIVADADKFDAQFFGISPAEATLMDPQQRLFLEVAWEALEHAGCNKDLEHSIGVFAGTGVNTYYVSNVLRRPDLVEAFGEFNTVTANDKDYLTTRLSHKLNLKGPSVNVQTACSTSLVAVVEAYWALMTYQCDVALAGGSSITTPINAGYSYQEGGMLSSDGHCRPFDAKADGTLFNSGVGVVILKRVEDAVANRDRIYAVIRGAALNNDGQNKVSFTAPSVNGQAEVIRLALDQADFQADSISYVETHGTATPLGDPIEIEALSKAYRLDSDRKQFCGIGSVKSNFGHLVAAAGVAGLMKTALSLYNKTIAATINFRSPNAAIDFPNSPFYVVDRNIDWQASQGKRRAGVSSFGVGGTNAHVVMEESESVQNSERPALAWQLVPVSAKTEEALATLSNRIGNALEPLADSEFADATYTLQAGRVPLSIRRFVIAANGREAKERLATERAPFSGAGRLTAADVSTAFLFPGQGSQYAGMARDLYDTHPTFRETMDACAAVLRVESELDLIELLYGRGSSSNDEQMRQTRFTQPALFAVEYALARLWMSVDIKPEAMIGHSVGEFVAACLAGVFSLDDALRIVATRGQLMQDMPPGAMLSVRTDRAALSSYLTESIGLAAVNAPQLCVVAGPEDAIEELRAVLDKRGIANSRLHTSHAFHSAMMEPAVEPLARLIETVPLSAPKIPIVSTVTGTWLKSEQAQSPDYWAGQLRATVCFGSAVETLTKDRQWVLVETGPRGVASQMVRQQLGPKSPHTVIRSLGDESGAGQDVPNWLEAIGRAWIAGAHPQWEALHGNQRRNRRPMPTYPFARTRYWAEVNASPTPVAVVPAPSSVTTYGAEDKPMQVGSTESTATVSRIDNVPRKPNMTNTSRRAQLTERIKGVLAETSGMEPDQIDANAGFIEQGFDSLFLTQVATAIKKTFGVKVTFRQLMEDYSDVESLAEFLDAQMPSETETESPMQPPQPAIETVSIVPQNTQEVSTPPLSEAVNMNVNTNPAASASSPTTAERLIQHQLEIMQQQLAVLGAARYSPSTTVKPVAAEFQQAAALPTNVPAADGESSQNRESQQPATSDNSTKASKPIGPAARISTQQDKLTPAQAANLQDFVRRYNAKTKVSKEFAQGHRHHLADPRTASGFRPIFKEMVYPIVISKSKGSRMWDLDGNEYIDLLNGFGSNMLGHLPDYIQSALREQLELGLEIGPQTQLAGEVAELFCELTGMERMAFSNTGSEAVTGAMRIARTVTGKNLIATFDGDYHGIFDEVLVRGSPNLRSLPASPGVNPESVQNMLVLPFNDPSIFNVLRERGEDIAGILVECVQGRDPKVQPAEFLRELRKVADEIGAALICDEVITGFRIHPKGAQGYFGIDADLATYGKIVGGGLPIGIIAGKAEYMDALDGGHWQYGDDSIPQVGVTYFAGTFVRHPLTLAAARATLRYMHEQGPSLQENLNRMADEFAREMNDYFQRVGAPYNFTNFGSLMNLNSSWDSPFSELIYFLLRERGVHIWHARPCFLTTAHTHEDLRQVVKAFQSSIEELGEMGFLEDLKIESPQLSKPIQANPHIVSATPPTKDAKLGRDKDGNPGWFIPDPERPGKYLQVGV